MRGVSIKTDDLRQIVDIVFEKISSSIGDSIVIEKDYYRDISMSEAFDLEKEATNMVGSLFDDWAGLRALLTGEGEVAFLNLDRLAALLRAISEELSPSS